MQLVKKATCASVVVQEGQQFLLTGASGSETGPGQSFRWVLLLLLLLLLASPALSSPGIVSLWTRRHCWSCGPQTVPPPSVWTSSPSWMTLLWTCS